MNRTEFIIITAIVLFAAVLFGWIACWLFHRLTRATSAELGELDRMARDLHEAEEARDLAVAELEEREAVLASRLTGAEAELQAAMEGLQGSRAEVEELRDYIEKKLSRR